MNTQTPHTLRIRVYYEDTDTGGVVYYANYLKFFERGRTEYLRSLGLHQRTLAAQDQLLFVVRRAEIDYRSPAYLDDALVVTTQITEQRGSSLYFQQGIQRQDEQLASARIQVCSIHAITGKPVRIPAYLYDLLN